MFDESLNEIQKSKERIKNEFKKKYLFKRRGSSKARILINLKRENYFVLAIYSSLLAAVIFILIVFLVLEGTEGFINYPEIFLGLLIIIFILIIAIIMIQRHAKNAIVRFYINKNRDIFRKTHNWFGFSRINNYHFSNISSIECRRKKHYTLFNFYFFILLDSDKRILFCIEPKKSLAAKIAPRLCSFLEVNCYFKKGIRNKEWRTPLIYQYNLDVDKISLD